MKMCRTFDSSTAHHECASTISIRPTDEAITEQSRVRARALHVGENGFRVDNNGDILMLFLAERT